MSDADTAAALSAKYMNDQLIASVSAVQIIFSAASRIRELCWQDIHQAQQVQELKFYIRYRCDLLSSVIAALPAGDLNSSDLKGACNGSNGGQNFFSGICCLRK